MKWRLEMCASGEGAGVEVEGAEGHEHWLALRSWRLEALLHGRVNKPFFLYHAYVIHVLGGTF